MNFGLVLLGVGALTLVALAGAGLPRLWRLALFLPFWAGILGVFQAREKTCVALASRGQRDMDAGPETIADPAELARVSRQVRTVRRKSLALSAALVAVSLLIPR